MDGHFNFGGLNSADYNVWIKGGGTYGAASRRFTTEIVPGRNGELTIDDGAFEEKEHTYEAFIGENFSSNIDGFRNALMSLTGRQILTDTYHPGEFYLARYMRGLEPDVLTLARAGSFAVTFSRDPRRFLVSGNAPVDVSVTTETLSGASVSFDNATGADRITGLSVSIMAEQSGNGDPSPTNIRPITGWTGANVIRTGRNIFGGNLLRDGIKAAIPTASDHADIRAIDYAATVPVYSSFTKAAGLDGKFKENTAYTFIVTLETTQSRSTNMRIYYTDGTHINIPNVSGINTKETKVVVTSPNKTVQNIYRVYADTSVTRVYYDESGLFEGVLTLSDFEPYNGTSYSVTWSEAGTVYGGTLDVLNGVLIVKYAIINIDGTESVNMTSAGHFYYSIGSGAVPPNVRGEQSTGWCSHYKLVSDITSSEFSALDNVTAYNNISMSGSNGRAFFNDSRFSTVADFKSYLVAQNDAGTPVQYIYKLANPITYQLIPVSVAAFAGENNIFADCGDVTVTVARATILTNPTRFTAQPLIRVYGRGRVDFGGTSFTIAGSYPYVDIDTELGDCSYNGINANPVVSFSGGYPVLDPGDNYITFFGVTRVEVTPRWWKL